MKKIILPFILSTLLIPVGCKSTQPMETISVKSDTEPEKRNYWQQHIKYIMDIDMNVNKHQYLGKQTLYYTNNSPDTLHKVFYHLYWNAFQPESGMDWRARSINDPDHGLEKKIQNLKNNEIGFIKIKSLTQDSTSINYQTQGSILEVELNKPISPHQTVVFQMNYLAQIPKLLRRSGRDNIEGIDYSMAQWYPKMAEYDTNGWHTDPYIGREFYGVWGDFDVTIHIPKKYTIAATGHLLNPENIGKDKGYISKKPLNLPDGNTLTWHFYAHNVHDFSWAADPDYIHDIYEGPNQVKLHFFYQNDEKIKENWKKLQKVTAQTMVFYNKYIGNYPYDKYSVIQAGDGGMEYAMCTFVLGNKTFGSLRGTTQHELGHAWFQFSLATNESLYPWMDEGFTSFIQDMANINVNNKNEANPFLNSYRSYEYLVQQKKDEPLSTHSDHYNTNLGYWIGAYDKGKLVLTQLGYIMGFKKLNLVLKEYYKNWKMKHPQPDDFFKIAEKISEMNLKWFKNDWIETIHHTDYSIDQVVEEDTQTKIILKNNAEMPMPVDILIIYKNGNKEQYYIPLDLMRGEKANSYPNIERKILKDWGWTKPTYSFTINKKKSEIKAVLIDPVGLTADINRENNIYIGEKK